MTSPTGAPGSVTRLAARVRAVDEAAREAALERHRQLAKPAGALGHLEQLGAQLAAIARRCPPPRPTPAGVAVFAGDHGVVAQGVTPWPQSVTSAMVRTFCRGNAAISVLARAIGARVAVVDVGLATPLQEGPDGPAPPESPTPQGPTVALWRRRVRAGTADISVSAAMTVEEAEEAMAVGAEVAASLLEEGAKSLVMGEMGIGNTTASAALIAALVGVGADVATGRGTGIDDAQLAHKVGVVEAALRRAQPRPDAPFRALVELGGLEIAALVGFVLGGAAAGAPVVVDGVISLAAVLVAHRLCPAIAGYCIAGHRSTEPSASIALAALGLRPLVDLDLRLGEGTGAALAVPLVDAAALLLTEMATLQEVIATQSGHTPT